MTRLRCRVGWHRWDWHRCLERRRCPMLHVCADCGADRRLPRKVRGDR